MPDVLDEIISAATEGRLTEAIGKLDDQIKVLGSQKDRLEQLRSILFGAPLKLKREYKKRDTATNSIADDIYDKSRILIEQRGPLTSPELSQLIGCGRPAVSKMLRMRATGIFTRDSSKRWHLAEKSTIAHSETPRNMAALQNHDNRVLETGLGGQSLASCSDGMNDPLPGRRLGDGQ